MSPTLRDGSQVEDVRLDRIPQYDERSRNYQVRQLLEEFPRRSASRYPARPVMNQGEDGACVWFSLATGLNASPKRQRPPMDGPTARENYFETQRRDQWEGGEYPGASPVYAGTSVIAGLQLALEQGHIGSYYWCGAGSGTAIDDMVDATIGVGGVQLGIPWFRSMFRTDERGVVVVDPGSGLAGYHAIWVHTFRNAPLPRERKKVPHFVWQNTWGDAYGVARYGIGGHGYVTVEDVEQKLLPRDAQGEAAVPIEA